MTTPSAWAQALGGLVAGGAGTAPAEIGLAVELLHAIVARPGEGPATAASAVYAAEARYRTLVEQIPAVTFIAALDGGGLNEIYVSPQIETLLGYTQKEWVEDPVLWYERLHPDEKERWNFEAARTLLLDEPFRGTYRFVARSGKTVWVHGEIKVVRDPAGRPLFMHGVGFDVTETKLAEVERAEAHEELERRVAARTAALQRSLAEKEVLLREVHHRVKNNLQVISSLFNLQSRDLTDPATLAVFRESQHRIRAMAMIHEHLYRSTDLASVDLAQYVRSLGGALEAAYRSRPDQVKLVFALESVTLAIDQAVPCGLVLNELIANAFEHGFPGDREGSVTLHLRRERGDVVLVVADDGVGLPPGADVRAQPSLGLRLVTTLVEHQLGGEVTVESGPGARFAVRFPATGPPPGAGGV